MNLRLFLGTFLMIFPAELGDKTQFSVIGRVTDPAAKRSVFAVFYARLAQVTVIHSLEQAFADPAQAENRHVAKLQALLQRMKRRA
jgi:hypothetical protein